MPSDTSPDAPARAASAHRKHGPRVWDWARADYEGGQPASVICKTYNSGLSTFRERAAREGWRRCDAEPEMLPADADRLDALSDNDDDPHALALLAWKRFALSLRDGDRLGARAWLRLHREMRTEMRHILDDIALDEEYAALRTRGPDPDRQDDGAPTGAPSGGEPEEGGSPAAAEQAGSAPLAAGTSPQADGVSNGADHPDHLDDLDHLDGFFDPPPPPSPQTGPPETEQVLQRLEAALRNAPASPAGRRLRTEAFRISVEQASGRLTPTDAAARFAAFEAAAPP
jgi:hypothetical protein